jgi:hypothetical protein
MTFIDDAKNVLFKSYANWLGIASAVFGLLAQLNDQLPAIRDFIPAHDYAILAVVCAAAVPLARIIKQRSISGDANA